MLICYVSIIENLSLKKEKKCLNFFDNFYDHTTPLFNTSPSLLYLHKKQENLVHRQDVSKFGHFPASLGAQHFPFLLFVFLLLSFNRGKSFSKNKKKTKKLRKKNFAYSNKRVWKFKSLERRKEVTRYRAVETSFPTLTTF